jgi:hypothetical protein
MGTVIATQAASLVPGVAIYGTTLRIATRQFETRAVQLRERLAR